MRLTKRDSVSCLAFACEDYSDKSTTSGKRFCSFSIPIRLKSKDDFAEEPELDEPDVFPSLFTNMC